MILGDHGIAVNMPWPFYRPVAHILMLKATLITNVFLDFAVLILSCRDTQNIITFCPQDNLTAALITLTVCVQWIREPYAALKPEGTISQRSNRTNIDHVS